MREIAHVRWATFVTVSAACAVMVAEPSAAMPVSSTLHFAIDSTASTVTYYPGGRFQFVPIGGELLEPVELTVSGVLTFLRTDDEVLLDWYDPLNPYQYTKIELTGADVVLSDPTLTLPLPNFLSRLDGTVIQQFNGCSFLPLPTGSICVILFDPYAAAWLGSIDPTTLTLSGQTAAFGSSDPYFAFNLVATAVPEPATTVMLSIGLASLLAGAMVRRRPA